MKIDRYLLELVPNEPSGLYKPVFDTLSAGGKRVRPILTALAAGLTITNDAWLPAAAAVELLHTFTLVHDDIMDNAATRRGQPTTHVRYGTNAAILSGDVLIALAQESLARMNSQSLPNTIAEFGHAFRMVCEGQALDKEYETRDNISTVEYLHMIDLKTSKVLELAAVFGALAGGGTYVEELRAFARHLGLAFQIGDDLLDLTANHSAFGKTIGGDILEGKRTMLFVTAMDHYSSLPANNRSLLDRIRDRRATPEDITPARELFQSLGVLEAASEAAKNETSKAKDALLRIPASTGRDRLDAFSDYLLERAS